MSLYSKAMTGPDVAAPARNLLPAGLFRWALRYLGAISLVNGILSAFRISSRCGTLEGPMPAMAKVAILGSLLASVGFLVLAFRASRRRSIPALSAMVGMVGLGILVGLLWQSSLVFRLGTDALGAVAALSSAVVARGAFLGWLAQRNELYFMGKWEFAVNLGQNCLTLAFLALALARQPRD